MVVFFDKKFLILFWSYMTRWFTLPILKSCESLLLICFVLLLLLVAHCPTFWSSLINARLILFLFLLFTSLYFSFAPSFIFSFPFRNFSFQVMLVGEFSGWFQLIINVIHWHFIIFLLLLWIAVIWLRIFLLYVF